MARARNIKPGFYKNEDLAECSIWARFIYPGLWMLADREGRLEDRPKRIKAELLPFDTIDVEPLLNELRAYGFIERYEVDGRAYIQIIAFSKHQNPHHREPESTIPPPPSQRLSTDGTQQKPEALQPCNEQKALGKPGASLGPDLGKPSAGTVLAQGQPGAGPGLAQGQPRDGPADSLNPDYLTPDTGVSRVIERQPLSRARAGDNPTQPHPPPTRIGQLCKQLRSLGIDAAPHLQAWAELLPAYSDEEIIAAAEKAREKKPGERLHLNYLLPILRDRKAPTKGATNGSSSRKSRIDSYAAQAAAARGDHGTDYRPDRYERIIDGEVLRVA